MKLSRLSHRAPLARFLSLSMTLLLLVASVPSGSLAQETDSGGELAREPKAAAAEFVPGEALVRFRSEAKARQVEAAGAKLLLEDGGWGAEADVKVSNFKGSEIVPGLRIAKFEADDTLKAIAQLNRRADVLYAEPNYIWRKQVAPNDTRYIEQYAMQRISAEAAWDSQQGSKSVVVAVIDEGIKLTHPDLAENAWVNPNDPLDGFDNDGNGFADDTNGWDFVHDDRTVFDAADGDDHGTHVAGTVGAKGNNGAGVTGVSWNVSLMSVKVLGPGGGSNSDIIAGYNYVWDLKRNRGVNVRVTNNSYGGPGESQSALAAIQRLNDEGILVVVAAGNDGRDNFNFPDFPANYNSPNVLAVASTNNANPEGLSSFSNFGARLVSIGAPGSGILSTVPNPSGVPSGDYANSSGTSMASPHVAGAAAVLLASNPSISVANLRGALAFTGDRITSLTEKTTTGRRLNVKAALDAAVEGDSTAPAATTLSISSQSGRSLTLSFIAPGDDGFSGQAADYDFFFVNPATNLRILMPTTAIPAAGGAQQAVNVDVPFRNFSGTVEMRAYDNLGNFSTSSVAVSAAANTGNDPYVVTPSANEALSTGGTALPLTGDDKYLTNQSLPFPFPFYGQSRTAVTVSTNGVLYFSTPPRRDNGDADDADSSVVDLQRHTMIAGLWDDLEIDAARRADAGIFVVQPDPSRVIYRWQATTFPSPLQGGGNRGVNPVNFEIELRSDGTIITRYGGGNQKVVPVVGISAGEPSAYDIASHTSENTLINLPNAQTITFSVRPAQTPPPQASVQFNTPSFGVSEAAGRATLTVTRTGDLQTAGSVQVRTIDNPASVRCDNTTTLPGVAFARCDYSTTIDTLNFPAGTESKTINVPLINDAHVEPSENVQLTLSNPTGGIVLGAQTTLTLTIASDDAEGAQNPLDTHAFFVRQHYLDFNSREPEQSGFDAWMGVLNNCSQPFNHDPLSPAALCDRNTVSMGFFRSREFELKGLYVFRFYRSSYGRLPAYAEIIPDMRLVTGADGPDLFQKKAAFAEAWAQRQEFQAAYGAMTNAQFVDAMLGRYGLQQVRTPDPAQPDAEARVVITRAQLIAGLDAGTLTRGQVVRAVSDSDEVGGAEFQTAFVAMQYYGYLRRTPDQAGFDSWMTYLRANPNDYYTMVNGFVYSQEYRLRFGKE